MLSSRKPLCRIALLPRKAICRHVRANETTPVTKYCQSFRQGAEEVPDLSDIQQVTFAKHLSCLFSTSEYNDEYLTKGIVGG
uniref:Uncharacterized protein n=1 Tax=Ascaris lumbricoides TaxID=6252 RepID=A0A0M3HZ64_ASCLU